MRNRIAVMAGKAPATIPSAQHNAMPIMATAEELARCGMVRTLSADTASVCDNQRRIMFAGAHR